MALRFIRQPSETPNVYNSDDARMIRYAYGGSDGYVKNKGSELSHSIIGLTFRINSGVLNLQGYETEVDANGWTMSVINSPTKHYYSVYYEVNLATQDADIKSTYDTAGYPNIDTGDDLTASSTGTARMLLYRFTATSGAIADVQKIASKIEYLSSGDVLVPTQAQTDSSKKIANTQYVRTAIDEKKQIDGYSIIARRLVGMGVAGNDIANLQITYTETLSAGEDVFVIVKVLDLNGEYYDRILSGLVLVGVNGRQVLNNRLDSDGATVPFTNSTVSGIIVNRALVGTASITRGRLVKVYRLLSDDV